MGDELGNDFLERFGDHGAVFFRKAVPERRIEQHDIFHRAVVGDDEVLLDLVVLHALDGIERVFLRIDHAGLQRGVELAERQRDCRGAKRVELLDEDV